MQNKCFIQKSYIPKTKCGSSSISRVFFLFGCRRRRRFTQHVYMPVKYTLLYDTAK